MKTFFRPFCIFLLVSCFSTAGFSLQTEFSFDLGNLTSPVADNIIGNTSVVTNWSWGLDLHANNLLSEDMAMEAGLSHDPILQNTIYTRLHLSKGIFSLGVGPFFGVFNTPETVMKSGISTLAKIEFPGTAYVSFRSDSTIGGNLISTGDYLQEYNFITAGYYVTNAICSLNMTTKRFLQRTSSGITDQTFTEYAFKADLFKKNIPYTALITLAYQQFDAIFNADKVTKKTIGSIVIGTRVQAIFGTAFTVFIDLESCVYAFGLNAILGNTVNPSSYVFRAKTGVSINTDELFPPAN